MQEHEIILYKYLVNLDEKYLNKSKIKDRRLMSDRLFEHAWCNLYLRKLIRQVPYIQENDPDAWNYCLVIIREGKLKEEWLNVHNKSTQD